MEHLNKLEEKSIFIIREAYKKYKNPALLWSIGKDSTVLLWLCKKAFFGKIPFPVLHIDTGYKFKEIYDFKKKYAEKWNLNLITYKNEQADKKNITPQSGCFECCNERKTNALKQAIKKYNMDALLLGIRRDEHGMREKERYFSPRDKKFKWNIFKTKTKKQGDSPFEAMQDTEMSGWDLFATEFKNANHVRIHPLLHWTEKNIWEYIKKEKIPITTLYFSKNNKRYRSIGCECCCTPIDSNAKTLNEIIKELEKTKIKERQGRAQNKEIDHMQKLRMLGYM